ncbi:MAG: RNA polymerase factor sigma-54, partial [Quisquiliibacterium sp.]
MKPSLQFKHSQQLALTPQLQQSIRLLQLSTLELNQEIEQLLAENPLLERLDDPLQDYARIEPNGSIMRDAPNFNQPGAQSPEGQPAQADHQSAQTDPEDGEQALDWSHDSFDGRLPGDDNDEERSSVQVSEGGRSLRDHLMEQLAATRAQPLDRALVELLIDNLDEDGFLDASL